MSSNSECTGESCPVDFSSKKSATTCPVDHSSMSATNVATTALSSESEAVCPVDHNNRKTMEIFLPTSAIKKDRDEEEKKAKAKAKGNQGVLVNPDNQMPMVPEQQAHGGQRQTLSTQRVVSSIPRADRYAGPSECPSVSASSDETVDARDSAPKGSNWVYPSEQMFFNAMRRKNWDPKEADMHSVVPIHNAVNEKCWMQILEWEKVHRTECSAPMLLKFEGRSGDLSPRAKWKSWIGYQRPFDRHDWTVDRCGTPVRYIIDFYEGKKDPKNPLKPSFYLDVRPAMTVQGTWDRARRFLGL